MIIRLSAVHGRALYHLAGACLGLGGQTHKKSMQYRDLSTASQKSVWTHRQISIVAQCHSRLNENLGRLGLRRNSGNHAVSSQSCDGLRYVPAYASAVGERNILASSNYGLSSGHQVLSIYRHASPSREYFRDFAIVLDQFTDIAYF